MEMREVRRRAGEILAVRGNRLLLIEALIVLLMFLPLYSSLSYACAAVTLLLPQGEALIVVAMTVHAVLTVLLTFLFTAPVVLGLLLIAAKMTAGEATALSDLFFAFSDRHRYARALVTLRVLLFQGTVVWFACELTYLAFVYGTAPTTSNAILCGALIGGEILGGLVWILCRYPLVWGALRFDDRPLCEAYDLARERIASPIARGWRYVFSFLPWLLLGALSVGILWIADTLPRMLIAYFLDCDSGNVDEE